MADTAKVLVGYMFLLFTMQAITDTVWFLAQL